MGLPIAPVAIITISMAILQRDAGMSLIHNFGLARILRRQPRTVIAPTSMRNSEIPSL